MVVALDRHLRTNQSIFIGFESLTDYYARLDTPRKGHSPAKRIARTPGRPPKREPEPEPEPAPKEEFRYDRPTSTLPAGGRADRATNHPPSEPEYVESVAVSPTVATPSLSRTNARQSRSAQQTPYQTPRIPSISAVADVEPPLPASPAVVTEAIDAQTTKLYEGVQRVWKASGVVDHAHALRANLSNVKAIQTIVLLVEGVIFLTARVPIRYLTAIPAIKYFNTAPFRTKVPDLFAMLESDFWVPFSVWFFTCFALPLVVSYFFNLSWNASNSGRRTRSSPTLAQFDPLIFNIAKALLAHLVLNKEITGGLVSQYTLRAVRTSVPGGERGVLTGTAIGAIGAIYEAILTRA